MKKKTRGNGQAHRGHLVIIGGAEDRERDKVVLRRFVELAGGEDARVVVLTAASVAHEQMWSIYDGAFGDLGVKDRETISIASRDDANDEANAARLLEATGIFMTGGDQKRLLSLIGGTRTDGAMHRAFRERGTCIGGTSAGASAMSEHMLAEGGTALLPERGAGYLGAGLGFLQRVVIDQHFSERQRLGRLLGVVAQNPYLLGIGIDEDTALVVEPGLGIEVIGDGDVTLIDGRQMSSNYLEIDRRERLELINVKLHLLPSGARYHYNRNGEERDAEGVPPALREAVAAVTSVSETVSP